MDNIIKRPAHRPKITLDKLRKDWKEYVLSIMSEGASLVEVYGGLNFGDKTHARLMKEETEYSRTIKKGLRLSEMWWQQKGRMNLENKDFNPTLWYMNMKNRFGWRDKHDHTTNGKEIKPIQLLGGDSVKTHDSNREDTTTQ